MSDKVRNSLFNALGDVTGLEVLDVFAGSGALAIEAISRGANSAVTIDADKYANDTIKKNIKDLGLTDKIKPIKAFFATWSNNNRDVLFDLIVADPPYHDLQMRQLSRLPRHLKINGSLVMSFPRKEEYLDLKELQLLQVKKYGDAQLVFYRKVS